MFREISESSRFVATMTDNPVKYIIHILPELWIMICTKQHILVCGLMNNYYTMVGDLHNELQALWLCDCLLTNFVL